MASVKRPNFLIIVADDLGFSDPGCFGGEIRTPNIDKLSKDGVRLTGFHSAAACSPTRAMILTGTDHHIAGLGNLIEWTDFSGQNFPKGSKYTTAPQRGMPGYEGYLNQKVATLPEILRDNGYHTMMSGKWHLGLTPERSPLARGFERSLALLPACSNHFDWRPKAEFPKFLEKSVIALHMEDDHYVEELPKAWYSSNGYGDRMLQYLKEWKDRDDGKPFFSYYPFSAPHWPLQAPKEYVDHYKGVYDEGPEALRQKRLKRLIELGMIPKDVKPHPVVADEVLGWDEMSDFERNMSCRAMEAYAGMVECLDHNIGRVTDYLESIGELDNTYIMFMSDNGAEGAAYEAYPMIKGDLMDHLGKYYNNSLENIGEKDSFVWYGPRWAQAATAPSRLYKAYTTEGGVRVPCVLRYPPLHKQNNFDPITETFSTVMDIAPTVLELAGITHPAPTYQGRTVVPMRGKSMADWLSGKAATIHDPNGSFGWELCGRSAIRKGHWKADFIPFPKGTSAWQLYDLSKDPGETDDLAEKEPKILEELMQLWEQYCEECGVVPLQPELGARWHEAVESQMKENQWIEYEYWKPGGLQEGNRDKFRRLITKVEDPRMALVKEKYANRKPRHQKPTAHISYDEGLNLIKSFLDYASHHTVEELQSFTSQWVPHPRWVKVDSVTIPSKHITDAADVLIKQLGHHGINRVGGTKWWQWRRKGAELKADWIEMRGDYNARKKENDKGRRIMLYVHGGAYFFGSVDEHRYQLQRHARKLRARVFAPRYRLAPQFPFPCGLQDCMAAYMYLLTVQDPSEIILAGDSAGGGMVVSMMVMLRDQSLPLPAGAVLISPWVDPTHSFPSVAGANKYDYIPAHGFMQRPSSAWPPPNDDEIQDIAEKAVSTAAGEALPRKSTQKERKSIEEEAVRGFAVYQHSTDNRAARENPNNPADSSNPDPRVVNTIPGPGHQLPIELDGKLIVLKDQIQMYTTNQLLSHPLVCPVLTPSLGGLPPVLILTGGGEILRDEQIYLAHKMAYPHKYPPGDIYLEEYDPDRTQLNKYNSTNVQLQVWDDLCHVAPTLSFTRPAKFMYRSVAQFGAWALARAQNTSIEITDDDNVSVITSGSNSDDESSEPLQKPSKEMMETHVPINVGKAGDPLPAFKNHMIRQRVDRHGNVYPLAPASELPGCQIAPSDVGVIKAGPVRKWLAAKGEWDRRYAREKRRVQKQRVRDMARGGSEGFGSGEQAPPSAVAGSRKRYDEAELKKQKKSYGLMLWSMFGSKHDEHTIEREEELEKTETRQRSTSTTKPGQPNDAVDGVLEEKQGNGVQRITSPDASGLRSRSRRRTVTITDRGQTEGQEDRADDDSQARVEGDGTGFGTHNRKESNMTSNSSHLAPGYVPANYKNKNLDQLRDTDRGSVSTSAANADAQSVSNLSTKAVFAAPGLLSRERKPTNASNLSMLATGQEDEDALGMRSEVASTMRPDTPISTRSNERLQSHQVEERPDKLRSPSTIAVVRAPGVVGEVDGEEVAKARR